MSEKGFVSKKNLSRAWNRLFGKVLNSKEEIEANTSENMIAGAEAVKEVYSSLQDSSSGESFNFGSLNGVRGFFTNPSKADDSFVPFKTSYGKSIENTEFFKENGGLDASDYISIHSRKHMYDPDTVSTPKKTQYGKDVNVGKLCEDTIMKPDEVIYNKDQNVMIYKKEYPFNISTSDTPTGTHRVFIPLNTQGKKTIRMSQFPLVGGN